MRKLLWIFCVVPYPGNIVVSKKDGRAEFDFYEDV